MANSRSAHRKQVHTHVVSRHESAALPRIVRLVPQPARGLDLSTAAMNLFTFCDFGPLVSEARQLAETRHREEAERRAREEAARAHFAAD